MRKCTLPILPFLLAAVITGVFLPAGPAHAQSKRSTDPKDREIELLKTEIKQLEQRVDTLEGLNQRVKVIDQKVDVQAQKLDVQSQKIEVEAQTEQKRALDLADRQGGRGRLLALFTQPRLQYRFRRNHPGRWPLLLQRRGQERQQHVLPEPSAADSDRLGCEVLQLQHHARLRPGQGRPARRLPQYHLFRFCQPEEREVQGAAGSRAPTVGSRPGIQPALGDPEPGPEPRHWFRPARQTSGRPGLL